MLQPVVQVGTKVKWRSRAYEPWKEGEVLAFIPKWQQPHKIYRPLENVADSQCQMGNGRTGASSLDRYLIRVDRIGAKGQALKPVYFAPSAAVVERCSQIE